MKTISILLASVGLLASCKKAATEATSASPIVGPSAALSQVLSAIPSGEPLAIPAARSTAKPGDEITLRGRIMGSASPFVEDRALFILGDTGTLTPCTDIPGDSCETPWDVCCETPEEKKLGTATIQIVDANGRVLKESLEGIGGIAKLAHITVTGKVANASSPELLLINATAIRVGE